MKRILVIDDEQTLRELLQLSLEGLGFAVTVVADLKSAKITFDKTEFAVCLTDMRLPDGDGLEFIEYVQASNKPIPVAVLTAYGNVELAVEALKHGAFDFLSKPIDLKILKRLLDHALNLTITPTIDSIQLSQQLIGTSPTIQQLREKILKLACSQAPIFIHGPTGAGKELVARMIHQQGPRCNHPFIAVNCGAIPAELMESEFFGHVKGSFTSAHSDKIGLFQAAHGGTLFLDEIAELPITMQVKLLRVIQERSVRAIGSAKEIAVDVRILSATHRDLETLVATNAFRQDLFYRINVIALEVPALAQRKQDLTLLITEIIKKLLGDSATKSVSLTPAALEKLNHYDFPGNIRELENILERAITLSDKDYIDADDLILTTNHTITQPATEHASVETLTYEYFIEERHKKPTFDFTQYLESIEKKLLLEALEQNLWNRSKTAKALGVSFRSLRYRIKKLDLDNGDHPE